MSDNTIFPDIAARDLQGRDLHLPAGFAGERNVVIIAFQRNHQSLVDSWVPWLEEQAASDTGLSFYELPTIGRLWAPARRFIDGGMAAAIREPVILQRTLTIYGDVTRLTRPLGIVDRSTISVLLVDAEGTVLWQRSGAFDGATARELEVELKAARGGN
jgi:hypothetical protein